MLIQPNDNNDTDMCSQRYSDGLFTLLLPTNYQEIKRLRRAFACVKRNAIMLSPLSKDIGYGETVAFHIAAASSRQRKDCLSSEVSSIWL